MLVNFTFDTKEQPEDNAANDEHKNRLYDKYSAERAELNRTALEIGGRYDKAVFILAGGSFALSITFIEKIAPHPTYLSIAFLAISWVFLLSSLVLSLFATSRSQSAIQRQIVLLDLEYQPLLFPRDLSSSVFPNEASETDKSNPYINIIRRLDVAARWTLIVGLVCLCLFAVVNVMNKETTNASKITASSSDSQQTAAPPSQ
jgi:hypothetical protein